MNIYELDFTIEYPDINQNNELSDYGFFKYLQEVGCLHASLLKFGLDNSKETHLVWILLDWKLKIYSRPAWKTKIHVVTWPSKMELATCYRDYEIYGEDNTLLAKATSKWVLFNIETNHISKIFPEVASKFSCVDKHVFNSQIEKLKEPLSYENTFTYTILRKDIDTNHHVNNLNYIQFALEALPLDVYQNTNFSSIEIMYKKQCLLGDTITCYCHKENEEEYIISVKNSKENLLHAIIRLRV